MKYQQLVAMPASVQDWLGHELETRGIDAVYTRYILSLLQQDSFDSESGDNELYPTAAKRNLKEVPVGKNKGKSKLRAERFRSIDCEEMKKSAAVECLMSVSEQKCGIEKLVDELCDKLKSIQGTEKVKYEPDIYGTKTVAYPTSQASSSPEEQAEKYYAAFPALCGTNEPPDLPAEAPKSEMPKCSVWESKKSKKQEKNGSEKTSNGEETKSAACESQDKENIEDVERSVSSKNSHPPNPATESTSSTMLEGNSGMGNYIKPSFIVPKYKTNTTSHQKISVANGKSPFNLPQPKNLLPDTLLKNQRKKPPAGTKHNFDQHSEENTEESSLDNSFDDDFPIKSGVTSTAESNEDDTFDAQGSVSEVHNAKPNPDNDDDSVVKLNSSIAALWSSDRAKAHGNIWDFSECDVDSAACFPYGLQSLFAGESESTVNLLWLHSKLMDGKEILPTKSPREDERKSDESTGEILAEFSNNLYEVPFQDLIKKTMWECQADETFIQGGVYGSGLSENRWVDEAEKTEANPETKKASGNGEDEVQFVWDVLGNLGNALQSSRRESEEFEFLDAERNEELQSQAQLHDDRLDRLEDLKSIWNSMQSEIEPIKIKVPQPWSGETSPMRSDSKDHSDGGGELDAAPAFASTKNCTLTYHKGESRFVEVTPSSRAADWLHVPPVRKVLPPTTKYERGGEQDGGEQENLLTSPKTHFRPIRQDSCESDSTASTDDNGEAEKTASATVKASDANAICDLESLYLYGEDNSSDELCELPPNESDNCEKLCQTCQTDERARRPSEENGCADILNAVIDVLDGMLERKFPGKERGTDECSGSSLRSASPVSLVDIDDDDTDGKSGENGEKVLGAGDSMYFDPGHDPWTLKEMADTFAEPKGRALSEWSTAQEEKPCWYENAPDVIWNLDDDDEENETLQIDRNPKESASAKGEYYARERDMKSLQEEMKIEEERLFEDIDNQRILNLENSWGSYEESDASWMRNAFERKSKSNGSRRDACARGRTYSSSDADDDTHSDINYSNYGADVHGYKKLPAVPASKMLYSADLEEEWRRSGKAFDLQVPKIKYKKSTSQKRPCSFYLEGNCRRSDCKFSHDLATITCRFWEEGSCFKGITCPFLHGYHSHTNDQKEKSACKADFKLELESEAHFPSLSKSRLHARKQEPYHSSSSDSTPLAQNKRRRRRIALKQRAASPNSQPSTHKNNGKFLKESRNRQQSGSSTDDDNYDI